jgi:hypothetical protein
VTARTRSVGDINEATRVTGHSDWLSGSEACALKRLDDDHSRRMRTLESWVNHRIPASQPVERVPGKVNSLESACGAIVGSFVPENMRRIISFDSELYQ